MLPRGACTKQPRKHKLREGSFLSEKRSSQQQFRRSCAHVVFFFISPFTPVAATFFPPMYLSRYPLARVCLHFRNVFLCKRLYTLAPRRRLLSPRPHRDSDQTVSTAVIASNTAEFMTVLLNMERDQPAPVPHSNSTTV
jgi:hypothetical protein